MKLKPAKSNPCCICGEPIDARGSWKLGHNAEPIAEGRCCTRCNDTVVIPRRLHLLSKRMKKGTA